MPRRIASHDLVIAKPLPEDAVPCPISQWNTLMDRIKQCDSPPDHINSIAWTCAGLSGGFVIAALTLPPSVQFMPQSGPNYWAIFVETFLVVGAFAIAIVSIIAFIFGRIWRKNRLDLRHIILDDMTVTRDRFRVI